MKKDKKEIAAKKIVLLFLLTMLLMLILSNTLHAQPYLECDASAGITSYKITAGWIPLGIKVPAQADGSLKYDCIAAPAGLSSMTVSACVTDLLWGEACITPVNFTFTRPSPPATIKNLRLSL